mgnify:CR=1 FL=1
MPGHVKLGGGGEPDPDPLPYLVVTPATKRKEAAVAYDPKRSVWAEVHYHYLFLVLVGIFNILDRNRVNIKGHEYKFHA